MRANRPFLEWVRGGGLEGRHAGLCLDRTGACVTADGCTYERTGPVAGHYDEFKTRPPNGNTVYVCHAYGCKMQTRFQFTERDIACPRPDEEDAQQPGRQRRAPGGGLRDGWMESRVGKEIGTDKDRPGMDFQASGDPTSRTASTRRPTPRPTSRCSTTTASSSTHHHAPDVQGESAPRRRRLAALTAVLVEKTNGQRWAVDSWIYANGENPAIVEAEKWYIDTLNNLPIAMR